MSVSLSVDHANPYTNQIFQEAVSRNDAAVVKLLLKFGINPKRNERNMHGLTALQQSVLDGHGRMAVMLLEAGADVEAKTSNGWTSLHIASAIGDLDVLTMLIKHCADLVALTKNEELPIDLAATREIKIELAKEMSRIGYSELAQWYMRKLAAREGVFYVLSTNTLLDMACDDHYDNDHSYPYVVRNKDEQPFTQEQSPEHFFQIQNSDGNYWQVGEENLKYLSSSSGYVSEVVYDSSKGEYTKATSRNISVSNSPARQIDDGRISIYEENEDYSTNSLLRRSGSTRQYNSIQRKPSKIELYIDYTNSTEDDDNEEEENINEIDEMKEEYEVEQRGIIQTRPLECDSLHYGSEISKMSFNQQDDSNEFCNCPNCKKMGYAFSPDIRTSGRKFLPVGENNYMSHIADGERVFPSSEYFPATTTNIYPSYFDHNHQEKPRKRKNKLLSGIKSMFKESVKVQKGVAEPSLEDAGILFTASLHEGNKIQRVKQRNLVAKSSSFSGKSSVSQAYENNNKEFHVYSHNHIVHPPPVFDKNLSFHSSTNIITEQAITDIPESPRNMRKAYFYQGEDGNDYSDSHSVLNNVITDNIIANGHRNIQALDSSTDEDLIL